MNCYTTVTLTAINVNCYTTVTLTAMNVNCFVANVPWLKGHSYECELFCSECSLAEGSQL